MMSWPARCRWYSSLFTSSMKASCERSSKSGTFMTGTFFGVAPGCGTMSRVVVEGDPLRVAVVGEVLRLRLEDGVVGQHLRFFRLAGIERDLVVRLPRRHDGRRPRGWRRHDRLRRRGCGCRRSHVE